jgi:hypothetical protein
MCSLLPHLVSVKSIDLLLQTNTIPQVKQQYEETDVEHFVKTTSLLCTSIPEGIQNERNT